MRLTNNRIIIACAGSGKTSTLIERALRDEAQRTALVTYTNNNLQEIIDRFDDQNSGVPHHVDVMTWFSFLLRECARPYQRSKYQECRIESLKFASGRSAPYVAEADTRRYYFASPELIYSDKIARFVIECERKSNGAVSRRLSGVYNSVFVDEFQDLAGWDLDVIKMLLRSGMQITLVGDPRQHIYSTNPSAKNKQFLGARVIDLVRMWENSGLCTVHEMNSSHRCGSAICQFANALWPEMAAMTSVQSDTTGHDGVFVVAESAVSDYIRFFQPQVLRHDKTARAYGCNAVNFGLSKGLQFDRVLIVPTAPIKEYLVTGGLGSLSKARERLYVAVTRARYSAAFVCDAQSPIVPNRWTP